ncbi:hypothetical protein M5689_006540 [Euphorbia peplus]|nr:hypothetical protein M5689_006540 [Euphorbia peplus]
MRKFMEGEKVEVCSNELGYVGSYYEATMVKRLGHVGCKNRYEVEYKNLVVEEGSSVPLMEVVSWDEVRPILPENPARLTIRLDDVVDAFNKDGR